MTHPSRDLDIRLINAESHQESSGLNHSDGDGSAPNHRTSRDPRWRLPKAAALSVQRQRAAWLTLVVGLPLLLGVMALLRDHLTVGTELLLTLSLTVTVAAIGGLVPGLVGAVLGALSVNWALVSPYGTLDIHDNADTLSLGVFVLVAIIVSTLVDQASRRAAEAARARGDAQALSRSAMVLASSRDPLSELAQEACTVLRQHAVAIFERTNDGGWERLATAGEDPPAAVADGTAHPVDEVARHVLVLHGRSLDSNDVVLLEGLADQIAVALESTALRREAAEVEILGRANALRNAILQAVSHDLRTPLTGIKASVTSLLSSEVNFSPSDTTLLLSTIDEEVDRLDRVVGNLLDMSRLHGGVLQVNAEDVPLEEIVGSAVASLGLTPDQVAISIPRSLPPVRVDDALVERAIANVLANAIAVQPAGVAVALSANVAEGDPATVELHIVDHGPGIATDDRELAVQPFQRLGDSYSHAGVGLGLAIASGMTHAIGGEMNLSDTTHGGLTVTFQLPTADDPSREDESLGEAN